MSHCSPTSKKLCGSLNCEICLPRSFKSHERSEEWSEKNVLKPEAVHLSSNKKFFFDCKGCSHEFELPLNRIENGGWCAYCNRGKLCSFPSCVFCFERSMASHPMAEMWSDRNQVTAREVSRGNDHKFWFRCKDCHHEHDRIIYSITSDKHCPYCSNQKLCEEKECQLCYQKSCACHPMSKEWSNGNEKSARMTFLQSNKTVEFDCSTCHHSYKNTPTHYYGRGRACSYCSNVKLCEKEECKMCYEKSFASHPRFNCWSPKNTLNARMTFKGSEKRGIFDCDVCHSEFDARLYNVLTGYWCVFCKNKSEKKVLQFLREEYPTCKTQIRQPWCRSSKTKNTMPFDFEIETHKILIELDGIQHFEQVSNWDNPDNVQFKDVEKIHRAIENGYSIIHIYQPEVWKDSYDWKAVLKEHIQRVEKKEPQCVFISQKSVYDRHISQLQSTIKYEVIHP